MTCDKSTDVDVVDAVDNSMRHTVVINLIGSII